VRVATGALSKPMGTNDLKQVIFLKMREKKCDKKKVGGKG
jgi:hypothetical protein